MHRAIAPSAAMWPIPLGSCGSPAQRQPGELSEARHRVHQPGFEVRSTEIQAGIVLVSANKKHDNDFYFQTKDI